MIVTAISLPKYEHRRMVHLQVQKRSTRTELIARSFMN